MGIRGVAGFSGVFEDSGSPVGLLGGICLVKYAISVWVAMNNWNVSQVRL